MLSLEVYERSVVDELIKECPDYVEEVETISLNGNEIFEFIIEMTKIVAPLIAGIIIANRDNNLSTFTIKKKGVNITKKLSNKDLTKDELIELLFLLDESDDGNDS